MARCRAVGCAQGDEDSTTEQTEEHDEPDRTFHLV
jgi:hypothetical protein